MNNPQGPDNTHQYVQSHLMHNTKQLQYIRSCFAAIAGAAAGILGLTNWSGFLFYALSWSVLCILLLLIKTSSPSQHFVSGWRDIVINGAMNGLLSYTLFHTLLYGLVHLYQ
ncbi:transmembrane protein 93-like protein [Halteromyces radiatus]|uniref:transmembrane protein 93-like protein n=1 Tax=Halteromyces radiatus TaxID=101107 RepID=UPI00221FCF73|nr:transmembrane protein 93-like protein [Halteromyces radiatus]KAI8099400.1 transmembrane protein 93-like protein [Halteromyces radiatus]